jgi:hypothetical protein
MHGDLQGQMVTDVVPEGGEDLTVFNKSTGILRGLTKRLSDL